MTDTKRKLSTVCPQCSSRVERFIINTDCEISMCESLNCSYPFNEQSGEGLNIETPNTSFIRYSKSNSKASSLSNTVAVPTLDDNYNAKSAKKTRTGSYKPDSSSSSEKKQKDKLYLPKPSNSDAHVVLEAPKPIAKSDLHINTVAQNNSISEITSFTPPPETDDQETKSSTSTSPSSAINIFDLSLPSPTSSVFNEPLSSQFDYSNITQKAPPPPPESGLCLPPMTAAKVAKVPNQNTLSINDYTLGDIESLLTVDNVNTTLQNIPQTEELSWMEDYNDLFL